MNLRLERARSSATFTMGKLFVDNIYFCDTLEDVVREDPNPNTPANEAKVYGETAIPPGRYRVVIDWSVKFKKFLPKLLNVAGFEAIRIHSGNTPKDTLGCILVGIEEIPGILAYGSRAMANKLFEKIQAALDKGEEVWIDIIPAR